jgi:ABC-type oligopeptide transport system ATPase subunit
VSALDAPSRRKPWNLLQDPEQPAPTYVFIAHMTVVEHICDRIAAAYLGQIVVSSLTDELFNDPKHPYTGALFKRLTRSRSTYTTEKKDSVALLKEGRTSRCLAAVLQRVARRQICVSHRRRSGKPLMGPM